MAEPPATPRFEDALADFDHLLKSAVTDWQRVQAHLGRARVLARLGRSEEAQWAQERAGRAEATP